MKEKYIQFKLDGELVRLIEKYQGRRQSETGLRLSKADIIQMILKNYFKLIGIE